MYYQLNPSMIRLTLRMTEYSVTDGKQQLTDVCLTYSIGVNIKK
ncbi:hypothetical protein [Peribacillus frigoritolerans]|nr:hypothetical protein [Peribacillus frigoritolerans]